MNLKKIMTAEGCREPLRVIGGALVVVLALLTPAAAAPPAAWTVMAYLDGDSDLEPATQCYLRELLGGERRPQLRVVVQVNMWADDGSALALVRYCSDEAGSSRPEEVPGADVEGPEGLANFVKWAIQRAPARRYALLIMGHGEPLGTLLSTARAGTERELLTGKQIARALQNASEDPDPGELAVVFLDSCYSATLEVIWELREMAHCVVGPPGPMYSPGLPWGHILGHLRQQPETTGRGLAQVAVQAARTFWRSEPDLPAALVAFDLHRLDLPIQALTRLSQTTVAQMPAVAAEVALARSRTMTWGPRTNVADLGGFANVLAEVSTNPAVAQQAWELAQAVRGATVASYIQGPDTRGKVKGTGLGIFFPVNLEQAGLLTAYEQLAQMSGQTGWGRFLQSYQTQLWQALSSG